MNLVTIYRISDYSNPEKVKPDYASKEDCLRVYVREFTNKNLIVLCDNVTKETHEISRFESGLNRRTKQFCRKLGIKNLL